MDCYNNRLKENEIKNNIATDCSRLTSVSKSIRSNNICHDLLTYTI